MSFTFPTLPTNIDETYPNRSGADRLHQQHHDAIHQAFEDYNAAGVGGGAGKNWLPGVWSLPGVNLTGSLNNEATSADVLYLVPFYVADAATLTDLAINVGTAAAGGNSARLGVYSKDSTGTSWTLVHDAGTVAIDSTGTKTISALSVSLPTPGIYGVAILCQAACSLNARAGGMTLFGPQSDPFATNIRVDGQVAQAYGALPASASPVGAGGFSSSFHRAMVTLD